MAISRNNRAYGAGKYGLELENTKNAGWISSVEGGNAVADVITEKIGGDWLQKKHLGNVKYEEISFSCGTGMSKALYEWVDTGFNQTNKDAGRKDGAITFADYDYFELSRLEWKFGLMTELGMPALDAAGKDACKMSLKFAPEITRRVMGTKSKITNSYPIDAKKQKHWTNANFRLRIDGMDAACQKVNKIEALTIKQKVTENAVGEARDYEKEATSVEIPNLVITMAESHSEAFYQWHEDFVIKGHCGEDKEKGGTLEYLANDVTPNGGGTVLFTLTFKNLGIFKIAPDKMEAGAEGIRRTKVEMYCEDIRFGYGGSTFG